MIHFFLIIFSLMVFFNFAKAEEAFPEERIVPSSGLKSLPPEILRSILNNLELKELKPLYMSGDKVLIEKFQNLRKIVKIGSNEFPGKRQDLISLNLFSPTSFGFNEYEDMRTFFYAKPSCYED